MKVCIVGASGKLGQYMVQHALGEWMGHPPTGRRFQDVDEIYIFRVSDGKLAGASGGEDNVRRMRQLGLGT